MRTRPCAGPGTLPVRHLAGGARDLRIIATIATLNFARSAYQSFMWARKTNEAIIAGAVPVSLEPWDQTVLSLYLILQALVYAAIVIYPTLEVVVKLSILTLILGLGRLMSVLHYDPDKK